VRHMVAAVGANKIGPSAEEEGNAVAAKPETRVEGTTITLHTHTDARK